MNYRQSSKSKGPNRWLTPRDQPVFHTKSVGHTSIPVERKRALKQTFASKKTVLRLLDATCIREGNVIKLMPDEASFVKYQGQW